MACPTTPSPDELNCPYYFVRGDANGDGATDISDAVGILTVLFSSGATDCADALDGNDDGTVNIADAIYVLGYLFAGGSEPPRPFPVKGEDKTDDDELSCRRLPEEPTP